MSREDSPYSTPESAFANDEAGFLPPTNPKKRDRFGFNQCFRDAKVALGANVPLCVVSMLFAIGYYTVLGLLTLAAFLGTESAELGMQGASMWQTSVQTLLTLIMSPPLIYGLTKTYLGLLDGEGRFEDLFAGILHPIKSYSALFFPVTLMTLPNLIFGIAQTALMFEFRMDFVILIGLLNLLVTVFVLPRLMYAYPFAIEQELSTLESFKRGWALPRGQLVESLLLFLLVFALVIGGFMLCFLPGLVSAPFAILAYLAVYRQKEGRPSPPNRSANSEPAW